MKKQKPEVTEIPSEEEFAIRMADGFLHEAGLEVKLQKNETSLDVILSIPEINAKFSLWLCGLIREGSFEELSSPKDVMLN